MQPANFLTDRDRKEAASIERRRCFEEERKKRIFNARSRRFGIDVVALEKQIAEKRKLDEEQKNIDAQYDNQRIRDDKLAILLSDKEKEDKKRLEKELNDFRTVFQKKEQRREFDLYDPDGLKKDLPARIKDDDPRLGLAACQKFAGEDLASDERKILLIEQQRSFLQQQIAEREAAEQDRKKAEEEYCSALKARNMRSLELESLEKQCRRKLELANLRYNKALANEQYMKKMEEEKNTMEDNLAEMYNTILSDLMVESPDVGASALGSKRKSGTSYKGMSEADKKAIRDFQKVQAEEIQKKRVEQKKLEQDWETYTLNIAKTAESIAKESEIQRMKIQKKIAAENLKLAEDHKAHMEYLNKVVYRNKPTVAFFDQFNASSR